MSRDARRNFEIIQLLRRDLLRMSTHDEMNLVRGAIDLLEQALKVDRSTRAGRGDYEFHRCEFEFNRRTGQ